MFNRSNNNTVGLLWWCFIKGTVHVYISIVSLRTNIASTCFSKVIFINIVCYSKLPPTFTNYCIRHWHFVSFLHSKLSILGTGSDAQTYYKTCQHQQKNVEYVNFFLFNSLVIVLVILLKGSLFKTTFLLNYQPHRWYIICHA